MQRKAIIVLGMHRSGTSAFARTLSLLGCDLPRNLVPETPTNPTGHWEPNAIIGLNDEILASAGSNWYDWLEFNPQWYESPVAESFSARARAALNDEYGGSSLFVLKDPRNCRLTRFWFDILDQFNVEPLVGIPLRNPLEVVASLEARDGMHRDLAMLLWLRHVLDAEQGSRSCRRIFFSYTELLDNWAGLADRMQQQLGIAWPRSPMQASADVEAFLDRGNRHHVRSTDNVVSNPALPNWVRDTYAILIRWASQGEMAGDQAVLDDIRAQLNGAESAFGQLTYAISSERAQRGTLHAALQARETELAQAETDIAALREVQAHDAQQGKMQVAGYEGRLAQLEGEWETLKSQSAALADERDMLREQAEVAKAERRRDAVRHAAQVAQAEKQTQDVTEELTRQRQEGEHLKCQLAEALALARRDREAGEAAESNLRAALIDKAVREALLEAELVTLREAQIRELETQKATHESAIAKLAEQLGARQQALDQVRNEIADQAHALTSVTSILRQRDEEIFQTLAQLEEARQRADEAVAKQAVADRRHKAIEDRLRSNNDWVFRLAGERRVAEEQLMVVQASLSLATERLANLEKRHDLAVNEKRAMLQQVATLESSQAELREQAAAATQRWQNAQSEAVALNRLVQQRDAELADALTAMAQDAAGHREQLHVLMHRISAGETDAENHARRAEWLKKVNAVMTAYPQWWAFMPKKWRQKRQQQRLLRQGLFDANAYLARYPDVLSSGIDPLRHYLIHGMNENRMI